MKGRIMVNCDCLLRLRDAAVACNDAAKNALAVLQWLNSGQGSPLNVFALPFPRGQTLSGRRGEPIGEAVSRDAGASWIAKLQNARAEWTVAARPDCLETITLAAVSLHLPPLQIGIDSFATAHEAAHRRAGELLYFLQGRVQVLPDEVSVDLRGRIEQEYQEAVKVLSPADGATGEGVKPAARPPITVVISLHGIRTRGAWQKELTAELGTDFVHEPLDYGFFGALKLLLPWQRRSQIDWFRDEYTRIREYRGITRPSVIAHSFATYLVTRALELYPEVSFDRVILCGSIVRRDFPWSSYDQERFDCVLNDYGRKDIWAAIAEWVIKEFGASGSEGFGDSAGGRVIQRKHPEFRHSDYFYRLNYQKNWIPFLKGEAPGDLRSSDCRPRNWKSFFVKWLVMLAILACVAAGAVIANTHKPGGKQVHGNMRDSNPNESKTVSPIN